jgi:hypothetical protein
MLVKIRDVLPLVAVLSVPLQIFANSTIVAEPSIAKANDCSAPNGDVVLEVSLVVKFRNEIDHRIILPTPSRVAGYELYSASGPSGTKHPLRKFTSRLPAMFDASRIDRSRIDSRVVQVIQPEGAAERSYSIHLIVRGTSVRPLLAGEYNLRVRIDPGPADQKHGKALARSWKAGGEVWIAPVTLPVVPLHIHETPVVEPCELRVD